LRERIEEEKSRTIEIEQVRKSYIPRCFRSSDAGKREKEKKLR
jgi:hypothetical protein